MSSQPCSEGGAPPFSHVLTKHVLALLPPDVAAWQLLMFVCHLKHGSPAFNPRRGFDSDAWLFLLESPGVICKPFLLVHQHTISGCGGEIDGKTTNMGAEWKGNDKWQLGPEGEIPLVRWGKSRLKMLKESRLNVCGCSSGFVFAKWGWTFSVSWG